MRDREIERERGRERERRKDRPTHIHCENRQGEPGITVKQRGITLRA